MNNPCGCCEGVAPVTPISTLNRPGLSAITYRVGTHATFLETMLARLSESQYPELSGLKTRLQSDPAIAFLDAWATVADVLTFYQERIANEGYLRTATERRSILELGRLVGYRLRPGVASSVYLAYTLERDQTVEILPGNRAQSLPGPGELPQSFETSDKLMARSSWNDLKPRQTRPQKIMLNSIAQTIDIDILFLQGTATNLKPNSLLLFVIGEGANQQVLRRVEQVELQPAANRTQVTLQKQPIVGSTAPQLGNTALQLQEGVPESPQYTYGNSEGFLESAVRRIDQLIEPLTRPPSLQPANALRLSRNIAKTFALEADAAPHLLTELQPALRPVLYQAWQNLKVPDTVEQPEVKVYALRTRASVFGHNAPKPIDRRGQPTGVDWSIMPPSETFSEEFNITVRLFPAPPPIIFSTLSPTPSDTPEPDSVAISATPAPSWMIETSLTIANQPALTDSRLLPGPDEEFTLGQTTDVNRVTVKVSGSRANNGLVPFTLNFKFANRPIVVEMGILEGNALHFSSQGSDPTNVVINNASAQPSRSTEPSSNQVSVDLTMTVNGAVKGSSGGADGENTVWLDAPYEQILPQSWIVLERPNALSNQGVGIPQTVIAQVQGVSDRSRAEYGITAKSTRVELNHPWIDPTHESFTTIRETTVFAQSEALTLADQPIKEAIGLSGQTQTDAEIELEGLYSGLEAGRWMIITGERADLFDGTQGVKSSELVMIAGVEQRVNPTLPGDKPHTFLQLAKPLAYQYKRDTVILYGNVVKATHGETRIQVLGSGDASKELQSFPLQQSPLTYLSAPTPAGAASTLEVRVNDIRWHETETLATLEPSDRRFITQTDDAGKTTVIFGNGQQGARPASGIENIKAVYRTGIGQLGNVKGQQISLLATRPLGVKSVLNPLPGKGGADPESRDQARRNLPLALMALDRLVSVQDYTDYARTYAGIGKASATRLSDGQRQIVHLTIAGAEDSPIDQNSDLYRNFQQSLQQYGDPNQPVQIELRELLLLVINANVQILPDYLWESVATQIRVALLETFSFDRRDLGQPVYLSEVIRTIQQVPGVAYTDVDVFGGIPEKITDPTGPNTNQRRTLTPSEIAQRVQDLITASKKSGPSPFVSVNLAGRENGTIHPAQIAYLTPAVTDTLILNRK